MPLTPHEVVKIAHLARLDIDADALTDYAHELSEILALVEQMNAVDTHDVTPMAHPLDTTQRLRPDQVTEGDERANFQAQAPATERGLYLVPKVIE